MDALRLQFAVVVDGVFVLVEDDDGGDITVGVVSMYAVSSTSCCGVDNLLDSVPVRCR